jgi:sugar (pentulose or hexulose) kinase
MAGPLAHPPATLGIDLGSSGLRVALVDGEGGLQAELASPYPECFSHPKGWRRGLIELIHQLPRPWRARIGALAIDGTSGTLLICRPDGSLLPGPLAQALPYHLACPEQAAGAATLVGGCGTAASASGSLARALQLLAQARNQGLDPGELLLRHQADWLMGWLLGHWCWGEAGNNLRLGWDLQANRWLGQLSRQLWAAALPAIRASGDILGPLTPAVASLLELPPTCMVVAGSTDANAGVLAAAPAAGEAITVLGTTLVLKQFTNAPIEAPGVSSHRVDGRWLVGGASNAGAGILGRFFSDTELRRLSRQIDPRRPSGLALRPLPSRGERFPVDDPELEPILEPRPCSDALYLQALLEGLTEIERQGWLRLQQLGAPPVRRIITLGGGAHNPQWRSLRQRALGVPVLNRPALSAALGMATLARRSLQRRPPP